MDKNVVTATVLIAIIMVVWLMWLSPPPPEPGSLPATVDTLQTDAEPEQETIVQAPPRVGSVAELAADDTSFVRTVLPANPTLTVETDLYVAEFSAQGGTLRSFRLKEYQQAGLERMVELVDSTRGGALGMVFTSPGSRIYDTRSFPFVPSTTAERLEVNDAPRSVTYATELADGRIEYVYTFTPGTYEIGLSVRMQNAPSFATLEGYELVWNGGIPFSEKDVESSSMLTGAYARSGGEVESIQLNADPYAEKGLNGQVDWVAAKNKYFAAVIIPSGETRGAELVGERFGEVSQSYLRHDYAAGVRMPPMVGESDEYRLYVGPLELSRIRKYDLDLYNMVDYGWDFFEIITRPLAKYVFIPVFDFLARFIPNYGLVIIIFSILIKLVLSPLTKSSFRSMARMRELQPRMEVIKEKYSDDPQKQQQAMMKMYKETGVNPIGGCLPMLLQYPIIIALWQFLPQAIEIRQQGFLWADDLSAPDVILALPFSIPFYGDFVAGFTLLMGLSMVVQMKMQMSSQASNPQMKFMVYVFPIMMFVIFNRLAAGLSLYYLCYNVLTALQQRTINKQIEKESAEKGSEPEVQGWAKKTAGSKNGAGSSSKSGSGKAGSGKDSAARKKRK